MSSDNKESIQLLNTAIIKYKEKRLDTSFEEKLAKVCASPAISALEIAIGHLAEEQRMSRDQAALKIIETIKELETVWNEYILMEGISNLKGLLKDKSKH